MRLVYFQDTIFAATMTMLVMILFVTPPCNFSSDILELLSQKQT